MDLNQVIKGTKRFLPPTDELLSRLSTGKAILFTGAGFSRTATNINGTHPPAGDQLAKMIANLGGFEEDDDLRYVSDYYLKNFDPSKLLDFLKKEFTMKDVSSEHVEICKLKWKRIYTTNYDNVIELASYKSNKLVEGVVLDDIPSGYYQNKNACVHINGYICKAKDDSLNNDIKLSNSSYISPESFTESQWAYPFKKDLESSSAIVFVGYSLYDIEIQKILFQNPQIKDKTYFITKENPHPKEDFTLSQFGCVLPIGVDGFAKLISENEIYFNLPDPINSLESLSLYCSDEKDNEIRDAIVERFLMHGELRQCFLDSAIAGVQKIPYLILRDSISSSVEFIKNGTNAIVFSELGNGKSVFLRELSSILSNSGINVYNIVDDDADYTCDLDLLNAEGGKCVVIVDGYEKHFSLLKHYQVLNPQNITLVLSSRTAEHEKMRGDIANLNLDFTELNIDNLSKQEIVKLVKIIDNIGLWGKKAALNVDRKVDLIEKKHKSQISLALLDLFKSPQIKDRVTAITTELFCNKNHKDTVFAISIAEILDVQTKYSLISELALNNSIYSPELRSNTNFNQLFSIDSGEVISKSSIFSLSLLKNHFTSSYMVDQLLKIVKKYNSFRDSGDTEKVIFKSLLKFSFIERVIPDSNKLNSLTSYYEKLKTSVPWLIRDPHYWLQFGMSRIPYKDYTKAQACFDQAYSLAEKRENYHTNNIDTQQARLFLLNAISENDKSLVFSYFEKANKLLSKLDNDVYKFRQVDIYRDVYESKYHIFNKRQKVAFEHACNNMVGEVEKSEVMGEINISAQNTIKGAKDNLMYTIQMIKSTRSK